MGLLRQHLTCLRAAMEICNAEVMGDELESRSVVFIPGEIKAGDYHFVTGSAGSTCLVFQTVLMPLLMAKGVSEIFFEGGTHNGAAPRVDFIEHCFLPVMRKMGCRVEHVLVSTAC